MTGSMQALLCASALALVLAGCGGSGENSTAAAPAPAPVEAAPAPAEEESAADAMATETPPAAAETPGEPEMEAQEMAPEQASASTQPAEDKVANIGANTGSGASGAVETVAASTGAASALAGLTGDAANGKRVFVKCMACHAVAEGQNRVGPSLYGIVGRQAGTIAGFNYSAANKNSGIVWTEEVMFEYLEAPQKYMPGTRMVFPGLPAAQDRADVIAYLQSVVE